MATNVYLKLKDGRRIRFGKARDIEDAMRVKGEIENWLRRSVILSVGNHRGEVEDIAPSRVAAVELDEEPSPAAGNCEVGAGSQS